METKKIALACFIGGMICGAVALAVAPAIWWLGVLAGFAGGYLSCEFREVRRAIPVAVRSATHESRVFLNDEVVSKIREWLSKPHPFYYTSAVITTPFYFWLMYHILPDLLREMVAKPFPLMAINLVLGGVAILVFVVLAFQLPMIGVPILYSLAFIGARAGQRCFWCPFFEDPENLRDHNLEAQKLIGRGYHEEPLTAVNVVKWAALGVLVIIRFSVWTLWKWTFLKILELAVFSVRFGWHLFKLIHSEKRLLCGVDGAIGGAVSYLWFSSSANPLVVVLFGGLLGAGFGILNWEVVSKRLLKVAH